MTSELAIIKSVQQWVETFVVALNICPFAKREVVKNRVRYVVSRADTRIALSADLEREAQLMQADEAVETCLLIHPYVLTDFLDYNDYLYTANRLLHNLGLEGVLQVASFHPNYQFAGTSPDDAENYTNRSPYPILHLLREDSLTQAIDQYPDTDAIPERNIELMNSMGSEALARLLKSCMPNQRPL